MLPEVAVRVAEHPEDIRVRSGRTWRSTGYQAKNFRLISNLQHKGGVGKTTYAHTIAVGLARRGKHVLFVDADSQMNATQLTLGRYCEERFGGDLDAMIQSFDMHKPRTVGHVTCKTDVLQPLNAVTVPPCELIPPCLWEIDLMAHEQSGVVMENDNPPNAVSPYGRFYLLQGSSELETWNTTLSQAEALMNLPNQESQKNVPGAIYHMMQKLAYLYNLDCVVVDLSPSNSTLNKYAVMTSHDFIVPCGLDKKNKQALRNLPGRLTTWQQSVDQVRRNSTGTEIFLPDHYPQLLGVMLCRFNPRGAVNPYNQLSALIEVEHQISDLVTTARALGMAHPPQCYIDGLPPQHARVMQVAAKPMVVEHGVVAVIPEYNTLQNMSERESVPVPFLQAHHFTKMKKDSFLQWMQAAEFAFQNQHPMPQLPVAAQLYMRKTPGENDYKDLLAKVADARLMFESLIEHIFRIAQW